MFAVLTVLFCLPSVIADAHGGAWKKSKVSVRDFTGQSGSREVAAMVAAFNEVMPERAPYLVYRPMGEFIACDKLPKSAKRGVIAVCVQYTGKSETDWTTNLHGQIVRAVVRISAYAWQKPLNNVICHEFMHALTGIPDAYNSKPDTSCVHGKLDEPGSFDVDYAKRIYKKDAGKDRKKHKRRHQ